MIRMLTRISAATLALIATTAVSSAGPWKFYILTCNVDGNAEYSNSIMLNNIGLAATPKNITVHWSVGGSLPAKGDVKLPNGVAAHSAISIQTPVVYKGSSCKVTVS